MQDKLECDVSRESCAYILSAETELDIWRRIRIDGERRGRELKEIRHGRSCAVDSGNANLVGVVTFKLTIARSRGL